MQTHAKTVLSSIISLFIFFVYSVSVTAQEIWGMTKYGGEYDKGVIFKMDENASGQEVVFSFETIKQPQAGLTEYTNGVFYGLSSWGGKYHSGVLYKFEADGGKFTKILDFDGEDKGKNGSDRMIYASNGKIYGTTVQGGVSDKGVLFEFDPQTESYTKILDFDGQDKGAEPMGSLLEGNDGKLYGTTASGGANDDGVLFSYDITENVFAKVIDFESMVTGAMPVGSLLQLSDGIMYGMTTFGGASDDGLIFRFDPETSQYSILVEFDEAITGSNPVAGLVSTPNGKVYGITPDGGPSGIGLLFEFHPQTSTFSEKVIFTSVWEAGRVCLAANDGVLYWVPEPELHSPPWVISYDPENDIYKRGTFASVGSREPSLYFNSIFQASNNKLYFIANATQNDIRNENILYEYDPENDEFTSYFKFSGIETGEFPHGSLLQALNGMLYGTTFIGGAYHLGVIFKIDPETNNYTKLIDFERESGGAKPNGGVVQADNLKLYGLTSEGGLYNKGVLYELDINTETFTKLVDFDGDNGENPDGDLIKALNGKLYGVTPAGGIHGDGVLFEFDPEAGVYEKLIDFQEVQSGKEPVSNALVAASNGVIYGTTLLGGLYDKGILFKYDPASGSFEKGIDYQETGTGRVPTNLIQGSDNRLYSHEEPGSINAIDPENLAFTKSVFEINYLNGMAGRLLQAANGKFYGMDKGFIWYRATDFFGGIHEYDIASETYTHIMEFSWGNGSNPENTSLIQLKSLSEPVAQCKNITLYLDENGQATLKPEDIDDGSTGSGIELTLSKSDFSCEDAGNNNVVLTATDDNQNTAVCTSVVTVADTIAPVVLCRDIEISLDETGKAVIEATDVDDGSTDACGIQSVTVDVTDYTCADVGENTVELTVADANGNAATCTAVVTVIDAIAPEVACKNMEVYLDATGNAAIDAANLDDGSFDACGIEAMALDVTSFTCDNIGENSVELTVTDNNGNTSTCTAVVTVTDTIAPEVYCSDIEVYLHAAGVASIEPADLDNGSTDGCGIESMALDIASFNCGDIGENEVELTVIDNNGNSQSCTALVTVIDNLAPEITCTSVVTEYLDPYEEAYSVEGTAWDAAAADNCTIALLEYDITGVNDSGGTSLAGLRLEAGVHEVNWLAADAEIMKRHV
jgi:uncharacterized repeat protein (TIGR03803 family)